jgi:inner membrane protein involved in colicin E2 resistance
MSVDKIKEQVGYLKVLFTICMALLASIMGWLVLNLNHSNKSLLVGSVISVMILASFVIFTNLFIIRLTLDNFVDF